MNWPDDELYSEILFLEAFSAAKEAGRTVERQTWPYKSSGVAVYPVELIDERVFDRFKGRLIIHRYSRAEPAEDIFKDLLKIFRDRVEALENSRKQCDGEGGDQEMSEATLKANLHLLLLCALRSRDVSSFSTILKDWYVSGLHANILASLLATAIHQLSEEAVAVLLRFTEDIRSNPASVDIPEFLNDHYTDGDATRQWINIFVMLTEKMEAFHLFNTHCRTIKVIHYLSYAIQVNDEEAVAALMGTISGKLLVTRRPDRADRPLTSHLLIQAFRAKTREEVDVKHSAILLLLRAGAIADPDPLTCECHEWLPAFAEGNPGISLKTFKAFLPLLLELGRNTSLNVASLFFEANRLREEPRRLWATQCASIIGSCYPRSLQAICRNTILRILPLGFTARVNAVNALQLPTCLTDYLNFSDLRILPQLDQLQYPLHRSILQ